MKHYDAMMVIHEALSLLYGRSTELRENKKQGYWEEQTSPERIGIEALITGMQYALLTLEKDQNKENQDG